MASPSSYTDAEIKTALKNKDQDVFAHVYDSYSAELFYFIQKRGCTKAAAEEVLQDIFLKLWHKADQYDSSVASLRTWLYRIARNAAIDKLRSAGERHARASENLDDAVYQIQGDQPAIQDMGIQKVLHQLDDDSKKVIDLLYFQGYSQRDAQKALDMPLGTLKSKARRSILKLRALLQNEKEFLK